MSCRDELFFNLMHAPVYDGIRRYYDQNTALFRKHESGVADAVHRSVYGPGVTTLQESFLYVNRLILERLGDRTRAVDLGCGIGGTAFFLCKHAPVDILGVTLSPVQAQFATARARELQLQERCRFEVASYLELPPAAQKRDFGYAIESFVHGPDPGKFFESAAAVIGPSGRLVICDDFLTERGAASGNIRDARWIDDFRWGWHVHSLVTPDAARTLAERAGFAPIEDIDLTPWLRLRRPWDRFISLCVELGRPINSRSEWWRSWIGSHGIQMGLVSGLMEYRFLVFERK